MLYIVCMMQIYNLKTLGPYWNLQAAVPPRAVDHRQGGCRQQLCQGALHHWEGADRGNDGLSY